MQLSKQKISFLFVLFAAFSGFVGAPAFAGSLAEMSYHLIAGSCATETPSALQKSKLLQCGLYKGSSKGQKESLEGLTSGLSKDSYLAGLAGLRSTAVSCALSQLQNIEKTPASLDQFSELYTKKLVLIAQEKMRMATLLPAVHSDPKASAEYKASRVRAEALLQSLQFSETQSMSRTVRSIVSQMDPSSFKNGSLDPTLEKSFQEQIKQAFAQAKNEFQKNKDVLDEGVRTMGQSLSRQTKESLAQDTDLVEQYRQQSGVTESNLAPVACQVDAEFGKGAQYRDRAILAVSVLGSGLASGVTHGASFLASSLTGAAAIGSIPVRTAAVLRVLSETAGAVGIINQVQKDCLQQTTLRAKKGSDNRCEKDPLESIAKDKCILDLVMTSYGGVTFFDATKKLIKGPAPSPRSK